MGISSMSRRGFLSGGVSLLGAGSVTHPIGVLGAMSNITASPEELFHKLKVPHPSMYPDPVTYLLRYGCSYEEYVEHKDTCKDDFIETLKYIPKGLIPHINFEESYVQRPDIMRFSIDERNGGTSMKIFFDLSEVGKKAMIRISDVESKVMLCIGDNIKGNLMGQKIISLPFDEAIQVLDQPIEGMVKEVYRRHKLESMERYEKHEKELEEIRKRGFERKYKRFLSSSALTPISSLVGSIIDIEGEQDDFSLSYIVQEILGDIEIHF